MTDSFASRRHGNLRSYRIFWRCERTQHKINRSGVGSKPPFAAHRTNVSYADKTDLYHVNENSSIS
ncbi:MAG: hypothetical protein CML51_04725 [Rhodobacteraceae bacterium]|nr:hypothetical protein [Paracoccaceae bacterium]